MRVNKELIKYVESNIFPLYEKHGCCHEISHIKEVIRKSLKLIEQVKDEPIDIDMVYTVGAFHDIGLIKDRKTHHLVGAQMLIADKALDKFFTKEQKQTMSEAIEDHRASLDGVPRNIYGKIVSTADRGWDLDEFLGTVYRYRLKYHPESTLEQVVEDGYDHTVKKFGKNGYAKEKVYFKDEDYEKFISELDKLIQDKAKFRERFLRVNGF